MQMKDYIAEFRKIVMIQIPPESLPPVISALNAASPWEVFNALEQLRLEGKLYGDNFECLLTDFFWSYCY